MVTRKNAAAAALLFAAASLGQACAMSEETPARSACAATADEVKAAEGAALLYLVSGAAGNDSLQPGGDEGDDLDPRARLEAVRAAAVENRAGDGADRAKVTLLRYEVVDQFGLELGDEVMLSTPACASTSGYYLMLMQESGASRLVPVAGPGDPLVAAARD